MSAQRCLSGLGGNRARSPCQDLHQWKCKNHCSHNNLDLCKDHASFFLISKRVFSAGHPLGVGVGLWASESKGLDLDTQVDFSSHLSLKNPFIFGYIKNTSLILYYG